MKEQNIYDNQEFFQGYTELRENQYSANNIMEKPALFSLCPDFTNKTVLDLGCGFGENCKTIAELGAKKVVGIDLSKNMLRIANTENTATQVQFIQMSMNDIATLEGKFDMIISSLAIHYIEDFHKLLTNVYELLHENGLFIYSQEHPLTTAVKSEAYWTRDEEDKIKHYNLAHYSEQGERKTDWIVGGVIKYHRSFSTIINTFLGVGFTIEKVLEPIPEKEIMDRYPAYQRYLHKPDFLLMKVRKQGR